MEPNKETTINDIYRLYLDGYTDNFLKEYDDFKKENSSLFTDFLDMFIKYKFPCENIIKNCLDNDDINTANFFIYLLNEFIDFYKSLDEVKKISEENNFSYINFFISNIITDKNNPKISIYKK